MNIPRALRTGFTSLMLSGFAHAADNSPHSAAAVDYSALADQLRGGAQPSNEMWRQLAVDEDKSIPMLLEVLDHPGSARRSTISYVLCQLNADYNKTKPSAASKARIVAHAGAMLSSSDAEARSIGMALLRAYWSAQAIAPLKGLIRGTAPSNQRAAAERLLALQLKTPEDRASQREYFEELRGDPDFAVSSAAHFIMADTYKEPAEIRAQQKEQNTPFGSVPAALTALQSGNPWQVSKASQELRRDGVEALPALVSVIESADDEETRSAAYPLIRGIVNRVENRTARAQQIVIDCLRSGKDFAVRACADLLPKFDTPETHTAAIECALEAPSPAKYSCLLQIVPPWGADSTPRLRKLLDDPNFAGRDTLIFVLANNGDSTGLAEARSSLESILASSSVSMSTSTRLRAHDVDALVDALGYIGEPQDIPLIQKFDVADRRWGSGLHFRIGASVHEINLRQQGDTTAQIKFLKKQFESVPDGLTTQWLFRLMGGRKAAEYLFGFVSRGPTPQRQNAFAWLLSEGWLDAEDAYRDPKLARLRDRRVPPEN